MEKLIQNIKMKLIQSYTYFLLCLYVSLLFFNKLSRWDKAPRKKVITI
jgi:hypothetical protein